MFRYHCLFRYHCMFGCHCIFKYQCLFRHHCIIRYRYYCIFRHHCMFRYHCMFLLQCCILTPFKPIKNPEKSDYLLKLYITHRFIVCNTSKSYCFNQKLSCRILAVLALFWILQWCNKLVGSLFTAPVDCVNKQAGRFKLLNSVAHHYQ